MDGSDFGFLCIAIIVVFMSIRIRRLERDVVTLKRWRGVGGKVEGTK